MARRALTIREETGIGATRAVKYCLTPLPPVLVHSDGSEAAAGIALSPDLDTIINNEQIIGTLSISGTATVMLPPEAETVQNSDGVGLRWRLTFGPNAESIETPHVTFGMPDMDVRVEDIIAGAVV